MSSGELETRARILEAAVRMLEENRGRGVRMGDIAKRAGVSRQAVYLHFDSRTALLVASTKYLDEQLNLERRLANSRNASSGIERLAFFIEAWGNYLPEIYGVARALLSARETDEAAAAAWRDRMQAMRDGCRAAIDALHADGTLASGWTRPKATDLLWTMLSVRNWEDLALECGWSSQQYIRCMKTLAIRTFVESPP